MSSSQRTLRKRPVNTIVPPKTAKSTKTTSRSTPQSQQTSSTSNRLSSINRPSLSSSTSRLSTTATTPALPSTSSVPRLSTSANQEIIDSVRLLETRLSTLEAIVAQLTTENTGLREIVAQLQLGITTANLPSGSEAQHEQEELNTNVVIRGVVATTESTESDLRSIYDGIRSHLNVSDCAEFEPVSVTVLSSNSTNTNDSSRPIRVILPSVAAKVKFLQIRRTKKDILQSDIGINSTSRRPILISEQLTRGNQELLYKARSLRGQNLYKFVWSSNGQILVRQKANSKVIRILDSEHVNRLRAESNLEPLLEDGRLYASTTGGNRTSQTSI